MNKRLILLIAILCASFAPSLGQSIVTARLYTTEDGLSQRNITGMVQDDEGFLWFASYNGLDRFDGYAFENFKTYPTDEVRISSHRFTSVDKSSCHRLWCTTYDQHCYPFDTETLKFEDLSLVNSQFRNHISKVYPLGNGITWLQGDRVLYRVDETALPRQRAVRSYTQPDILGNNIVGIYMDSQRREWILSDTATTMIQGQQTFSFIPFDAMAEADGEVFLATSNGLLARYDAASESVSTLPAGPFSSAILELRPLSDGRMLIVQTSALSFYTPHNGQLDTYPMAIGRDQEVHEDRNGFIWILRRNGDIVRVNAATGKKKNYGYPKIKDGESYSRFRVFLQDEFGCIWIKPHNGELCYYRPETDRLEQTVLTRNGQQEPLRLRTMLQLEDRRKNLWINSENGLMQLSFGQRQTKVLSGPANSLGRALEEDRERRLWVGWKNESDDQGGYVCLYDSTGSWLANVSAQGELVADPTLSFGAHIYSLACDRKGNMWIGTKHDGLYVLVRRDANHYRAVHYQHVKDDPSSLSANSIYDILQDSKGNVWLGTYGNGLNLADVSKGLDRLSFIHYQNRLNNYPIYNGQEVRCLCETRSGLILAGTTKGLVTFSNQFNRPEEIRFYLNSSNSEASSLSNNDIYHIFQHSDGRLFLSSVGGGLDVTDESKLLSKSIRFEHYNALNSQVSDLTLSVAEDSRHCLWVASENKLSQFGADMQLMKELKSVHPSEAAPLLTHDGRLLFGTQYDVTEALTDITAIKSEQIPVAFLYLDTHRDGLTERRPIHHGQLQKLRTDQRNCTISFSALDYSGSDAIQYAYRIPEKNPEWIPLGTNHQANLANMAAGDYTFQVRSTNAQGIWSDNICSLPIRVQPRFSETGWSTVLYVLVALALAGLIGFYLFRMLNLRRQVENEQKLSDIKIQFFTDISHELRTPLTLISSPVEEVLQHENLSEGGRGNLRLVQQNINRMMQLINQILDFRKIQDGRMKIYIEQTDIVPVIRKLFERFQPMAVKQRIEYQLDCDLHRLAVYTDVDKFEKIVVNLLSNAFKYTPSDKRISLKLRYEKDRLMVSVKDEGKGISSSRMNRLFDRFDTLDEANPSISTGLGLSLVKKLLDLLHGQIKVESREGAGSTFTVWLPTTLETYQEDSNAEFILHDNATLEGLANPAAGKAGNAAPKQQQILVIEDNEELRRFICSILNHEFEVLEAGNGREGLEKTRQAGPDLVISDIMMPEMDGIGYLKAVRGDTSLCHIPIILLSAKASLDDQIKGLDYGADDYITKPFSSSYLKAKIETILKQRQHLLNYFTGLNPAGTMAVNGNSPQTADGIPAQAANPGPFQDGQPAAESLLDQLEPSAPQITNFDREFLEVLVRTVEENFQNAAFRIDDLTDTFHMSRTVFYRKVKSLTGVPPVDFVSRMRIKRSIQLLEQSQLSISEIGYITGFTTPQYFTRVFKRLTGCTPKEYRSQRPKEREQGPFLDFSQSESPYDQD